MLYSMVKTLQFSLLDKTINILRIADITCVLKEIKCRLPNTAHYKMKCPSSIPGGIGWPKYYSRLPQIIYTTTFLFTGMMIDLWSDLLSSFLRMHLILRRLQPITKFSKTKKQNTKF